MKKLFVLIMGAVLLLASCEDALESVRETGSLKVSLRKELSRTLEPGLSMEADSIMLTLSGPNGESRTLELEGDGEEASFSNLRYGTWSLLAEAYNGDNALIGEGRADCTVHSGETSTLSLIISPIQGQGTLALTVSWMEEDVESPRLAGTLLDGDGVVRDLDFSLCPGEASALIDLNRGYYSLSLSLYDGDYLCIGAMEICRIIAGERTEGTFDFSHMKANYGSIDVNISLSLENPLHPVIGNRADIIGLSEPLIMTASAEEELEGISYAWYVDGQAVSLGESCSFISDTEGPYRIDLAAFSSDGARAGSAGYTLLVSEGVTAYMTISEIQGAGHISPYANEKVEDVIGVVTAVQGRGFWMQSLGDDGDFATSEGIYVYTYSPHSRSVGDLVLVDGTVQEYGYEDALKLTELNYVTVETLQSGYPLPRPVVIGAKGILPPSEVICNDADVTVYRSAFDPREDGIDFYEALESMYVAIDNPVAVGGTKYGEIAVVPRGLSYQSTTARGGLLLTGNNANPQRIHIDTDGVILGLDPLDAAVGDYFSEPVRGIIGYDYGKFLILPTRLPDLQRGGLSREMTSLTGDEDHLTVATLNLENFPRDDESMGSAEMGEKIGDMAQTVVSGLGSPDILCVQEMTDDSYSGDDGTVTADGNAGQLIDAILALGGPEYGYIDVDPEDKQDGGWTEANIRVGYFYNPLRVGFTPVGSPGARDETALIVAGDELSLSLNPGRFRIDSFGNSRKSLLAQFTFGGEPVFLINNHLCSKGGDDSLYGEYQPPRTPSEDERHVQAGAVRDMVREILDADGDAKIILVGDLNDYQFSGTLDILKDSGLVSLTEELLPLSERYSYVYNGNSQQLDHILVSPALLPSAGVDIVHRYAEFGDGSRQTDHDPLVASLLCSSQGGGAEGTLLISEYAEGSSNNKYVEIYNPGPGVVNMEGFSLLRFNNGGTTPYGPYELTGSLEAGGLYVIMNGGADGAILDRGDTALEALTYFNGDDCLQLLNREGAVIDQIGVLGEDPGSAWAVAGTANGTADHTLVRKTAVLEGNGGDWAASAGTGADDSEWLLFDQNYWDSLGIR